MRCNSNIIPLTNNKKETVRLYVTTTSFVLVRSELDILEIHFDGHRMTRRGEQHKEKTERGKSTVNLIILFFFFPINRLLCAFKCSKYVRYLWYSRFYRRVSR